MFTGIIEETGQIKSLRSINGGIRLFIKAAVVLGDLKPDDSVAVNGVCLTATATEKDGFWVDAVGETLEKTTLQKAKSGQQVNLERAVTLQTRLGGHMVQGHVNGLATVEKIRRLGENYALDVSVNEALQRYLILEGSVALDGISLTIARLSGELIGINIIPHTWHNTTLQQLKPGAQMNIEVDVIAKYVEKMLSAGHFKKDKKTSLQEIKKLGF